jgi:gamma-D-glutamyl-L-lysine dipeptidyl-peptidase
MPLIEINQANLFYETFGEDHPGKLPILLIHGSTTTGRTDWGMVAPLLARHYKVIVPDCRGHGQSENPNHSYSFLEMAADAAGLVQLLGYPRAHIIGHSNGGNVALVFLMEFPEVVQSAVLQAANAYVSQDLIDKEPAIFDPERVAHESPAWMNEMIALHAPTHGQDYWRELLQLTVQEIITQPNYIPQDLAKVQRPTLVIQGEADHVNAPAHHAQFIAGHIPDAELWIPAGVGHNVHYERLFEWIEHVEDFLERRGDPANDALARLRRTYYSDDRQSIFEVRSMPFRMEENNTSASAYRISGQVLTQDQLDAIDDLLPHIAGEDNLLIQPEVSVLLDEHTPWAFVNRNVTDVRREPRDLSERLTQALLGESLRVLEKREGWARVRLERDGYLGWVQTNALWRCDSEQVQEYQRASSNLVIAETAQAFLSQEGTLPDLSAGKLPFGIAVPLIDQIGERSAFRLPDGRIWWVASNDLLPLSRRPLPDSTGIAYTLDLLRRLIGIPYLWGGRSSFGYDCSGLAQTFLGFMGVTAPRDADQQFAAAVPVTGAPQPGDLLFFGSRREDARRPITHVAISLGGDEIIHANGTAGGISINSLNPDSLTYSAWLQENLVGVGRYWTL